MNNEMETISVMNSNINNEEPVETLDDNDFKRSKRKKFRKIIIIVIVVLALIIGGLYFYKEKVLLDKKKIIKTSISEIFNVLDKSYDEFNNSIIPFDANEESIGIDATFGVSSNYKDNEVDLTKLKDYKIKYNGAFDLKNNKLSSSLYLNKNDFSLLTVNSFINTKFGTVESRQLSYYAYNFTTSKEVKDLKINNKDNKSDIKKILSRVREIVLSRVNERDIAKDSYEETINGTKNTYTRFTYTLNVNNLVNDVLKNFVQDTSVLSTLSKVSSTDEETVKNVLQGIIDSNKGEETYNYEIYVDSLFGTFKQMKIYNISNARNYIRIYKVDDSYQFENINGSDTVYSGKYTNNKLTFDFGQFKNTFEKVNNNEYKITHNFINDTTFFDCDININSTKEEDKQNIKAQVKLNTGFVNNKSDDTALTFDIDLSIYKNATVKPITSFIVKDISTIDDNELEEIFTKFEGIINTVVNDIYKGANNIIEDSNIKSFIQV